MPFFVFFPAVSLVNRLVNKPEVVSEDVTQTDVAPPDSSVFKSNKVLMF